ncbi:Tad domain-containing protein [Marimonas lutisalis]|uniref:Tad domain-containing protein n=1 Tax=Marimonas lutisalis TaxID=2545756 RepID=UPI00195F815D|nr:Tad domain-containing protein [Marimonas lutisalis]
MARTRVRRFARDESGVMIAFSIFFFLIILLIAGIGVDLMRYEMQRTRLQATLDRAVLAAADMQQELDPVSVVQDYMSTAGFDDVTLSDPNVADGLNYRMVDATATMPMQTQFMHMMGVDTLITPAVAGAEEKIEGIEIALVLDISGSMNWNDRLINLKPAAREFIDTVTSLTEAGDVSVSIIPYNTQVNAGAALLGEYNVSDDHDMSYCLNFEAADFNTTAMPTNHTYEQTAHFDMFSYATGSWPPQASDMPTPVCNTQTGSEITVMETDATTLKNKITALSAYGNTSIDIGMKWAAALLDPGTQGVIQNLIDGGHVGAINVGRPVSYTAPDILKVIVVMTDGQNTNQYMLPDDKRDGNSDIYVDTATGRISIWNGGRDRFFWVHDRTWNTKAYGNHLSGSDTAQRLDYDELWAYNSVATNARYNYGPMYQAQGSSSSIAWSDWYTNMPDINPGTEKDIRLQNICRAAKDNGVMVYSIGFEATVNGNDQLRACASSPSHFFDANGTNITDTFQAIAVSIAQLRLTQ